MKRPELAPQAAQPVYKFHLSFAEKERLDDLVKFGVKFLISQGGRPASIPVAHAQAVTSALMHMLPNDMTPELVRSMAGEGARLEYAIHPEGDALPEARVEKVAPPLVSLC